ncbi:glycosyltransferase family 2 protein [Endozoicomonas euniceicola]|uniref:Glycosyltransferase family 2 protein n=1 Tax=Endozoicomonas euniceicola TaxID=1234143 RepID=A0ABY6GQE3_9GAMM|nr:glycosyltransferase family 2 protein [Endozoicomonas euniceicola]UYM14777.1 glycosyltransferase family 2 protein [Endozoicomonas euniceicola]
MLDGLALTLFIVACLVIIYHHAGYPLLLRVLSRKHPSPPPYFHRHFNITPLDLMLPRICLVMPAHNEADTISDKIYNLGTLDYPENKLRIIIVCDGCTDATADIARGAAKARENRHLTIDVVDKPDNCGKVAVLNEAISLCDCDVVVLSDVSALLSIDSLLITASQLSEEDTGVVCGSYQFFQSLNAGEQAYWAYQRQIKTSESTIGATLGVHGAFYGFRRKLFERLPPDTINDDFVLPVNIVMKGYKCLYDPRIVAVELEQACNEMDFNRRKRIAAGNVQQAIRCIGLLQPRFGKIAFNFFSGKFLRPMMPAFLFLALVSSAWLASSHWFYALAFAGQLIAYLISVLCILTGSQPDWKPLRVIYYIVSGHLAMGIGLLRYAFGLESGQWKKVEPGSTAKRSKGSTQGV